MDLIRALDDRNARVLIVGLGYVGLPLAIEAARAGYPVTGLDKDDLRVASLQRGVSHVKDVSDHDLSTQIAAGRFTITRDPGQIAAADVVVICVPTPLRDELPDMSFVEAAARDIAANLNSNKLIILESTTYPGTTEELLFTILETSGKKAGIDFFLGYSPERIDPGNPRYGLRNVPKIVGGIDDTSSRMMEAFYGSFIDKVVRVSSPRTAEMAKLLENTYRHVNIALVNEIAILCNDLGIDVWEVIDAAATKPFGFQPFYPGPGWGGHCIPVDPVYLSWRVRRMGTTARFVELAMEFNQKMPGYVVQRISEALNEEGKSLKGSKVLVLGVAYKADIDDLRESSALTIISKLIRSGASVSFHDPLVPSIDLGNERLESVELDEALGTSDLVLVHTAHTTYEWSEIVKSAKLVLDTRNVTRGLPPLVGARIVKL